MKGSVVVLALAALVVGCGSQEHTRLTIYAQAGQNETAFYLRCSPASGDVPSPAALCETIASHSRLMLSPHDTSVCTGDPKRSRSVAVRGLYDGKRVRMAVNDCALPEGFKAQRLWASGLPAPFGQR